MLPKRERAQEHRAGIYARRPGLGQPKLTLFEKVGAAAGFAKGPADLRARMLREFAAMEKRNA